MKRDRIAINKDLIPYKFYIRLAGITFGLEIRYNSEADLFTVALYENGGRLLCTEPIIYGAELFKSHYKTGIYPAVKIVPFDESEIQTKVTWENFGNTVYLVIDNM